jgi:hypothetical protein
MIRYSRGEENRQRRSRFSRPDLSGDDTQGAQIKGIAESSEGFQARQRVEVLDLDILREGFSLEAEEVLIASHRPASFRRVSHPDRILQWEGGV